jgi:hypothetical protein
VLQSGADTGTGMVIALVSQEIVMAVIDFDRNVDA